MNQSNLLNMADNNSNNPLFPNAPTFISGQFGTNQTPNNLNPNLDVNFTTLGANSLQLPGDMSNSKSSIGSPFPGNAVNATPFSRMEPLITPEQLKTRFLFGVPLYSNQKDPLTGKRAQITDEMLRDDFIVRAVNMAESMCHIDIFPVQRFEKHPFDKAHYEAFGFMLAEHKPILSLQQLAIVPSNNIVVYEVPLSWVESSYFVRGQINIVPLTAAFQGSGFLPPSSAAGGAAFLQILGTKNWIPAYWMIAYVAGLCIDGTVPVIINELVGAIAARSVLEVLGMSNKVAQYNLNTDGFGQSVNVTGTDLYKPQLQQLEDRIQVLIGKIKSIFSIKMIATTF
jgi:hypothetical protein